MNKDDEMSIEQEVCPICLGGEEHEEPRPLVHGGCKHAFCLPCLTQHFAAPSRQGEPQHSVPTMGRCPICRQTLCLLDLKWCSQNGDNKQGDYAVERETDMTKTDVAGLVFVKRRIGEGDESIHFPLRTDDKEDEKPPYVSFEKRTEPFRHDDTTEERIERKYFDPSSCRYNPASRTFHGTIRWDIETTTDDEGKESTQRNCGKRIEGCAAWEYILNFSSDFRYIARGVVIEHRNPCRSPECKELKCKFPFDGDWIVEYEGDKSADAFLVHGNLLFLGDQSGFHSYVGRQRPTGFVQIHHFGRNSTGEENYWLVMDWGDRTSGVLGWRSYVGDLVWNLRGNPQGPAVGDSISWEPAQDENPTMVWRRKTITPLETPRRVKNLGSGHGLSYHRLGVVADDSLAIPPYHADRLWGNVFSQVLTVGMASYHFNDDNSAYISYEHERTSQWPSLDDGRPIPPIMPFSNSSFNEESRTFRGTIDWEGTHGTTWTSSRWWRYEIVFSQDYSFIINGTVRVLRLGRQEEEVMSKFGEDLLYINAGFAEKIRREWESNVNTSGGASTFESVQQQMEELEVQSQNIDRLKSLFVLARTTELQIPATRLYSEQNYGI